MYDFKKFIKVNRFIDKVVGVQVIVFQNIYVSIGSCKYYYRGMFKCFIRFDDVQDFLFVLFRQVQIQQDKIRQWSIFVRRFFMKVFDGFNVISYDIKFYVVFVFLKCFLGEFYVFWVIFD